MADRSAKAPASQTGRGSSATYVRSLGGRLTTFLLIGAVLCGPAAIFMSLNRPTPVALESTATLTGGDTRTQAAGEYGLAFVTAWLSASRDDARELERFVQTNSLPEISSTPWIYRDAAIVSTAAGEDGDLVTVVIAADVRELMLDMGEDAAESWVRRYFQTVIAVADDGMLSVGLPAPIEAPATSTTKVPLDYGRTIAPNSAVSESVVAFLGAYLAGSGDLSRVIAPGATISAITPAPYASADILSIRGDIDPPASPSNGDQVQVLVEATLTSVYDQTLTTIYALTLTARDGRWEISAVDTTPKLTTSTTTPTSMPSSTSTPTP